VTLPIAASEGQCSDPIAEVSPSQTTTLSGQTTVKYGGIIIDQSTLSDAKVEDAAIATFDSITGAQLTGQQSSSRPSLGSCFVTQSTTTTPVNPFTLVGLEAGSISVQGPVGDQPLTELITGTYLADLPTGFIPAAGGKFTFTGTGGADVGPFTAVINYMSPLTWTNSSSDGTITRASGVTVDWNGGASGTFVVISGSSSSPSGFTSSFVCDAPVSAGTFTVPVPVLLTLPAGTGELSVSNYTIPVSVAIPQLDFAYAMAFASTEIDATYN
jgi:hypothetical protein